MEAHQDYKMGYEGAAGYGVQHWGFTSPLPGQIVTLLQSHPAIVNLWYDSFIFRKKFPRSTVLGSWSAYQCPWIRFPRHTFHFFRIILQEERIRPFYLPGFIIIFAIQLFFFPLIWRVSPNWMANLRPSVTGAWLSLIHYCSQMIGNIYWACNGS